MTVADTFASPAKPTPDEGGIIRDRWGRYVLPHPETGVEQGWTRATTFAKTMSDTYALHKWQERMVAKGLAMRPDLLALVSTTTDKKALDAICEDAKNAAGSKVGANLGTAVHNYTEQLDMGIELRSIGIPSTIIGDVASYEEALRVTGLIPVRHLIERVVICTKYGIAGRLDRVLTNRFPVGRWTEPGELFIGDVKTAAQIGYSWLEVAMQLAIYANADYLWNIRERTFEPMPTIDLNEAVVMHVPVQQSETTLYRIDIKTGWEYVELAAQIRAARSNKKLAVRLGETITTKPVLKAVQTDVPEPLDYRSRIDQATCRQDLSDIWQHASSRGKWTAELEAYGKNKLKDLRG